MSAAELTGFEQKMCACRDDDCRDKLFTGDEALSLDQLKDLAGACEPIHPTAAGALKQLDAMEASACACTDSACATAVEKQFEDWSKKNADAKGTRAEAEQAGKTISAISDCLMKAQQPPAPGSSH
jgi:hypothetical protein